MFSRKLWLVLSLFMVFALALSACAGAGADATGTPAAGEGGIETLPPAETAVMGETEVVETPMVETPMVEETPVEGETPMAGEGDVCAGIPAEYQDMGGTVNVLATWGGDEQDSFMAMLQPFIDCTGVQVEYEGTRDLNAVLTTRVQGGNPPELAGLPGPGQLREYANAGTLIPLNDVLDMSQVESDYDQGWLDLATVDGQLYGIFIKASVKSLIWYSPTAFEAAGYTVPETWEEMQTLEQQIVDDGGTPWCVALESGAASGWPGTDWIEDFVLVGAGVEVYDQWWQHQIPWTDPAIRTAWENFGEIVNDETMIYGGQQYVLSTNFGEAAFPLFDDPPGCYMTHSASFMPGFIEPQFPDAVAGENYDFFAFPPVGDGEAPVEVAGDLFGMFNDTEQARALISYLTTVEAQSIWAERGGFLSGNRNVPAEVYPDDLTRDMAQVIAQAPTVRFDASDLMPEAVNNAFWAGILDYTSNPDNLDSILENIESVAEDAYQGMETEIEGDLSGATATPTP